MVRCSLNGQWLMTNETDSSWPGKDTGSGKKTAQGSVPCAVFEYDFVFPMDSEWGRFPMQR